MNRALNLGPRKAAKPIETAAFVGVTIIALYFGQGIFVPLVLAVLVAFALNPLVEGLRRLHVPQLFAVMIVVVGVAAIAIFVAYLTATQLLALATELPQYQEIVAQKLRALQGGGEESPLGRLAKALESLGSQISPTTSDASQRPLPVTISNVAPSPFDGVSGIFGSVLGPLATGALVIIFSIFLLLERTDLRDRFLKLVSRGDIRTSTKVMNVSAGRVSRYLVVQFAVNSCFGIAFGAGMFAVGVPNAILWGLLSIVLRYIPFIGTFVAVILPAALAFAVDPGWTMLIEVVSWYLFLEVITTNAIEPRLYGSSTGLSALAVLVAAIFWATIWGPIGLVLATPITVCLVVLGRYVPQLGFLDTVLGSEPAMVAEERLYQRLLTGNIAEALELSESELRDGDVTEFFDRVALPALRLAETDLQLDATDLALRRNVAETVNSLIDELDNNGHEAMDLGEAAVLVIGGRTELDGAAAGMLAQSLGGSSILTRQLPPFAVNREGIGQLDASRIAIVCICYLGHDPEPYLRYAAARLRRKNKGIKIVACLFGSDQVDEHADLSALRSDAVVRTILDAAKVTATMFEQHLHEGHPPEVEASSSIDLLRQAARAGDWLGVACGSIAERLHVSEAIMQLKADASSEDTGSAPRLSDRVVATNKVLIVPDVSLDSEASTDSMLVENGFQSYLGVPLRVDSGEVIGTLSVYDTEPRDFASLLESLVAEADHLVAELQQRTLIAA